MKAALSIVLCILSVCSARSLFQTSAVVVPTPSTVFTEAPTALDPSKGAQDLPNTWPAKAKNTLRFAVVLGDRMKPTVKEIYWGYKFWAKSVNDLGGILMNSTAINYTESVLVDLRIAYNVSTADHSTVMRDAVTIGEADFLLGGDTGDAYDDQKVAQEKQRITMLCCHGPPLVYINATKGALAANNGTRNFLFGIHVSSEKYVDKMIRNIVVNLQSKKIALFSTYNGTNPESNPDATSDLFSRSTCDEARRQLEEQKSYDRYDSFPDFYDITVSSDTSNNATALEEFLMPKVEEMRGEDQEGKNRTDAVIGCTTDATGRALLKALKQKDVRLRTLFLTVAPTNRETVTFLAKEEEIVMEHILSAGQWHPEVAWRAGKNASEEPQIIWQDATDFSNKFKVFMEEENEKENLTSATYTIASAAAAAHALQLAIYEALQAQGCNLSNWNGTAQELFSTQWNCSTDDVAQQPDSKTGLGRIHTALRSLSTSSFFGNINFDENQRNIGRDALTFQLLTSDNRKDDSTLDSIDFGYDFVEVNNNTSTDADNSTTKLIQEIVLPSEYETKAMVLPNSARDGDPDWCEAGAGLDTNNKCTPCEPGSSRNRYEYKKGISSVQQKCNACAIGEYQEFAGQKNCTACPENTITLEVGAKDLDSCICKPGYTNIEKRNGTACIACPANTICPGGTKNITALEGFWVHESKAEIDILSCKPASACINIDDQTCGAGWGGKVCSMCGKNNNDGGQKYFLVFGKCTKCINIYQNLIIFICMLAVWLLVNLVMAEDVQSLSLLIDWMQLMSLVGNIPANWPEPLSVFYSVASFFAFDITVVSLRCLNHNWDFKWDLLVQLVLPLAIILLLSVVALAQRSLSKMKDKEEEIKDKPRQHNLNRDVFLRRKKNASIPAPVTAADASGTDDTDEDLTIDAAAGDGEISKELSDSAENNYLNLPRALIDKSMHLKRKSMKVGKLIYDKGSMHVQSAKEVVKKDKEYTYQFWRRVFNILEITYLALTLYSLTALRGIVLNDEKVVFRYPHTAQDASVIAMGIAGVIFYGILFPAVIIIMLWSWSPECPLRLSLGRRHKPLPVKREDDPGGFLLPRNRTLLGWLYGEFRSEVYYMSSMHLVHRFLFCAVVSLVINPAMQLLLSVLLTSVFAIWFIVTRPYYNDRLNVLQAVMYASILIQIGIGTCYYSGNLFSKVWRSRFEFASFTMIVGVGLVLLWITIMDFCDYSAFNKAERKILKYLRLRQTHNEDAYLAKFEETYHFLKPKIRLKDKFNSEEEAVRQLIGMFNPVKLWSWVEKAHPETQKGFWGSVWRDISWVFEKVWKKLWLLFRKISKNCCLPVPESAPPVFEKKEEMELFVEVAIRLKETGCFDERTSHQSLMHEAELWSFFVRNFPEGLSYLFNVKNDRAKNLDDFFKHFYLYYWRSKKSVHTMLHRCFAKPESELSKEGPKSKPKLKRLNAMDALRSSSRWIWLMGEFIIHKYDEITERERPVEFDEQRVTLFDFSIQHEVPGITWLILSKSRAQLARWLSKKENHHYAEGLFKCLVSDINKASLKFKEGCWEEKFMRVSSLNLMAIFRTIVPPEEMDRKLINDENPYVVEKPFESEDREIDAASLDEMRGGDSSGK